MERVRTFAFGRFSALHVAAVLALLSLAPAAAAQQTGGKKRSPQLTTDDVLRGRSAPTAEVAGEGKPAGSTPAAERGERAKEGEVSPEEADWRLRVKAARERAESLQRQAEETELLATELRNRLNVSGQTAQDRNALAAEMEQTGRRLTSLRAEAREAAGELNALLSDGRARGFTEASDMPAASVDGRPNEDYFRARFAKINEMAQAAERRIRLHENRLRELNERINNPNVDRFTVAQLQQDRDDALQQIEEARAALAKAQSDMQELMEAARSAGVPPGIFR